MLDSEETPRTERYLTVFTTTERREDAEAIAVALVEQRLAACVQIGGPIASHYWWKGTMERAEEWFCLIKSTRGLYDRLERAIKLVHPYETPEIIAIPIVAGSREYFAWIDASTDPPAAGG